MSLSIKEINNLRFSFELEFNFGKNKKKKLPVIRARNQIFFLPTFACNTQRINYTNWEKSGLFRDMTIHLYSLFQ